jgi:hypothetical protein
MMRVLPIAALLILGGCYDSLTEADLCNANFEDCSQYESNSSGSSGSGSSGGTSEIELPPGPTNGLAPCGQTHCSVGQECLTHDQCYSGICMTVTGSGAPGYSFCTEQCSVSAECLSNTTCMQMANDENYCVPMNGSDDVVGGAEVGEEGGVPTPNDDHGEEDGDPYDHDETGTPVDEDSDEDETTPEPDTCLSIADVGEVCAFTECETLANECFASSECKDSFICIMGCSGCCVNDMDCLFDCGCPGGPGGSSLSPTLQGLLMCISQNCS